MKTQNVDYRPVDARIWEEELADFIPERIVDAHAHFLSDAEIPDDHPEKGQRGTENLSTHRGWAHRLYPGRQMRYFLIEWPIVSADTHRAAMARDLVQDPTARGAMMVTPQMTPGKIADAVEKHGFIALKPYRSFSVTGDATDCRITDFLPESHIEVADQLGLRVILHLSKRAACADEENLLDLERLTHRYANVRWQLAHCARAFAPWQIERAIDRLRDIPNITYDLSAVCDVVVFWTLFTKERIGRLLYGSDGIYATFRHGNYFTFAYGWAEVDEGKLAMLNTRHCESKPTLLVYESLRAIRRAAMMAGLSNDDIEDVFWRNATREVFGETPQADAG